MLALTSYRTMLSPSRVSRLSHIVRAAASTTVQPAAATMQQVQLMNEECIARIEHGWWGAGSPMRVGPRCGWHQLPRALRCGPLQPLFQP